jgi:hypothetical protein
VEEQNMKKMMALCFVFALLVSMIAVAQDASQSAAGSSQAGQMGSKATSVSGKVSDDGKSIVDKDGKSLTVTNPDALKGHEGHEVTIKGDVDSSKNEVRVESVKMTEASSDTTKK